MVDQTQENSIFNSGDAPVTPEAAPDSATNTSADTLLSSIVAEDGRQKYATTEDALKALQHSQTHIQKVEAEAAELRAEVAKRAAAEEVLEAIRNEARATPNDEQQTSAPEFDVSQVETLVERKLQAVAQQEKAASNTQQVISAMTEKFGDQAEKAFIAAAEANGVSLDQLNTLAAVSPQAVLKLVGMEGTPTPAFSTGSINPESLVPKPQVPSARIKSGKSRDLVSAWQAAGELVNSE